MVNKAFLFCGETSQLNRWSTQVPMQAAKRCMQYMGMSDPAHMLQTDKGFSASQARKTEWL